MNLFTQIHEIVFYGKGGYDWDTVYNMPIWLRRFTYSKIKDFYKEKNNPDKNSKSTKLIDKDGNVNIPSVAQKAVKKKSTYK